MTVTELPTPEQFKEFVTDRTWVGAMELNGSLVRLPQPEGRQPQRKSWIDAALTKLAVIELVSNRNVILHPVDGNRVICRYDSTTFTYIPDGAGGTIYMLLPELGDMTIRARIKGRPKSRVRLNGRKPRTSFRAVTVWVVDNNDPDNLHLVMDRASETV